MMRWNTKHQNSNSYAHKNREIVGSRRGRIWRSKREKVSVECREVKRESAERQTDQSEAIVRHSAQVEA
jgi:hypothetical protein